MKILLMTPPFYRILGFYNRYFPLAIVSIGTVLKQLGHEVLVYDADFTDSTRDINYDELNVRYWDYLKALESFEHPVWHEAEKVIADFSPDLAGITVYTTFAASAFHMAWLCKSVCPECITVMGGPHAAVKAEEILTVSKDVDFVFRGEGERNLPVFIERFKQGAPLSLVPGLTFREKDTIVHNSAPGLTRDLDCFPSPDRGLLMNERKYSDEDMGLIMSSRGCPFRCSYCASETRRVSYRSIDCVVDEIKNVQKRYGTFQFTFKDDSFTVNRKRVQAFCEKLLREGIRINWECNSRVNRMDLPLLKLMKQAGCNFIKVGIESGSERVLKIMNKGITLDQCLEASKMLRRSGIHWSGYFMIGVPGETEADVRQTLQFMHNLQPDLALLSVYEPFPGTELFQQGLQRGFLHEEMTLKDYYRLIPTSYYKNYPAVQTDTIPENRFVELEKEITESFHCYNKRIGRVLKMASARRYSYFYRPRTLLDDIRKYLSY